MNVNKQNLFVVLPITVNLISFYLTNSSNCEQCITFKIVYGNIIIDHANRLKLAW